MKSHFRTVLLAAAVIAGLAFSRSVFAQAPAAANDAEVGMSAITTCMDKGKDAQAQSTCVLGVALTVMAARSPTSTSGSAPQVIVQQQAQRHWLVDAIGSFFGPIKDTVIALAPAAAQVYSARSNAHVQEVVAGYNRDSTIAGYQAFTSMNAQTAAAGTFGYHYVQAPGAVTTSTNTLSGTGVQGSGTYTGPVTTTRTCNGGQAGNGAGTTTGAPGGAGGTATC